MASFKRDVLRKIAVSTVGGAIGFIMQSLLSPKEKVHPPETVPTLVASPEAQDYLDRGKVFSQEGHIGQAVTAFTDAIRSQPSLARAYLNRGWAYNQMDQYDRAIRDCTEAIRLEPTLAAAYVNRGWAYGKQGHFARAVGDCADAIKLDPNLLAAYEVLSWAQAQRQGSLQMKSISSVK
jgi:tetratricopeptide (TPR) repeat protein